MKNKRIAQTLSTKQDPSTVNRDPGEVAVMVSKDPGEAEEMVNKDHGEVEATVSKDPGEVGVELTSSIMKRAKT